MTVARVYSAAPTGFQGRIVEVEGDATKGLPSIQIVGLANKAIDEAKERVKSALANSLLEYPAKRLTINLAPAELPKDGTHYDLPIALSVLVASGQLRQQEVADALFAGELALDGSIRPVRGIISLVEAARDAGITTAYIPLENLPQAGLVSDISLVGVPSLKALFLHLKKEQILPEAAPPSITSATDTPRRPLLDDVIGQEQAKRALIIAAAGRHNILLSGPPGTGKTMLARTLLHLLPDPSPQEKLAITKMLSLAGEVVDHTAAARPFRTPHHTASPVSLIGGGQHPKPGEISLAHFGVLFLDEFPEYPRSTLEALRQPMEDRVVTVSRAQGKVSYPADFMLVATMNPCPCGYYGDATRECSCSIMQIDAYQKRLSGPLLDRIDLHVSVPRIANDSLLQAKTLQEEQHNNARKSIDATLHHQHNRYKSSTSYNSNIPSHDIAATALLANDAQKLLLSAVDKLKLSTRAYFKIIRVARTIADLDGSTNILAPHVAEALQYRQN